MPLSSSKAVASRSSSGWSFGRSSSPMNSIQVLPTRLGSEYIDTPGYREIFIIRYADCIKVDGKFMQWNLMATFFMEKHFLFKTWQCIILTLSQTGFTINWCKRNAICIRVHLNLWSNSRHEKFTWGDTDLSYSTEQKFGKKATQIGKEKYSQSHCLAWNVLTCENIKGVCPGGGARAIVVVKALYYKLEGRWFETQWDEFFSIYLIPLAELGTEVHSASNRNEYQKQKKKCFWGVQCGQCIGLTTLLPSVNRLPRQSGILNILQPYRPPHPATGITFTFYLYVQEVILYFSLLSKRARKVKMHLGNIMTLGIRGKWR
jgi:hypothetical protein